MTKAGFRANIIVKSKVTSLVNLQYRSDCGAKIKQ
jgi:hypothetical protein